MIVEFVITNAAGEIVRQGRQPEGHLPEPGEGETLTVLAPDAGAVSPDPEREDPRLAAMRVSEARAWLATNDVTDLPLLAVEVHLTGLAPDEVAQIWLNLATIEAEHIALAELARRLSEASNEL